MASLLKFWALFAAYTILICAGVTYCASGGSTVKTTIRDNPINTDGDQTVCNPELPECFQEKI